jgi:hypothetical protein
MSIKPQSPEEVLPYIDFDSVRLPSAHMVDQSRHLEQRAIATGLSEICKYEDVFNIRERLQGKNLVIPQTASGFFDKDDDYYARILITPKFLPFNMLGEEIFTKVEKQQVTDLSKIERVARAIFNVLQPGIGTVNTRSHFHYTNARTDSYLREIVEKQAPRAQ